MEVWCAHVTALPFGRCIADRRRPSPLSRHVSCRAARRTMKTLPARSLRRSPTTCVSHGVHSTPTWQRITAGACWCCHGRDTFCADIPFTTAVLCTSRCRCRQLRVIRCQGSDVERVVCFAMRTPARRAPNQARRLTLRGRRTRPRESV